MLSKDANRLKKSYSPRAQPGDSDLLRIAEPLGLDLADLVALGDEIIGNLDPKVYGIGWWSAYSDIDRKTRILLSDYLATLARTVPDNLVEARIERLELDHAVEDFRQWFERRVSPGRRLVVKPPRGPFDDLAVRRVNTHVAGMLRAWGTALDCIAGTTVGVAGLPTDLKRADAKTAREALAKAAVNHPRLTALQADLAQAEDDAGPGGWREWLLGMRHTFVHRARRTGTWSGDIDRTGVTGFSLQLPVSPDLTEVEAVVHAGGQVASTFTAPAADMLDRLERTVNAYAVEVSRILLALWRERREDPTLIAQSPRQWKQPTGIIHPIPQFHGFPDLTTPRHEVTSLDVGEEAYARLRAAAVAYRAESDVTPDPQVWS